MMNLKRAFACGLLLSIIGLLGITLKQRHEDDGGIFVPASRSPSAQRLSFASIPLVENFRQILSGLDVPAARLQALRLPAGAMEPESSFRLVFPHAPAGQGGGLRIQSSVFLLNNSGANAQGTIFFYLQNGSPMTIETNRGTASSFPFELMPGQEFRLETIEEGDTRTGWVEVVSNIQLAGSGTFRVFRSSGAIISEVGVADSPRSQQTLLFVDTTEGKNTGFAVCNPNPNSALNLQVQLRRLDGSVVATTQDNLEPRNQVALFVTGLFPAVDFSNFKGVLVLSSADTDFAVITLRTRGLFFTSFPTAPRVEDVSDDDTLVFARIANGVSGNLKISTTFQLMNNSDTEADASIQFFDEQGQDLELVVGTETVSQMMVTVPANNAVELISSRDGPATVGWARVESSIPLAGGAAFTIEEASSGTFVSEVGIPDSPASPRLTILAQVEDSIDTGIALTNTGDTPVKARLRLVGEPSGEGTASEVAAGLGPPIDVRQEIVLQVGQHLAGFVSDLFGQVAAVADRNFLGRLEVTGIDEDLSELVGYDFEVPLTGLTLLAQGALLTTLPAAPYVVNFNPILELDLSTDLAGSAPRVCFELRQQAMERGVGRATIQLDAGQVDFSRLPEDTQIAGNLIAIVPLLNVINDGRLFVTEVNGDRAVFYSPLSIDETGEVVAFAGTIRNLTGGGFEVELLSSPPDTEPAILIIPGMMRLCFESGLIELPEGVGSEVRVEQEFMSMETMAGDDNSLMRNVSSSFVTSGVDPGAPRIRFVSPDRVVGGSIVEVVGDGFASTVSGNRVSVEANSRVEATVLEASPTRLSVELPQGVAKGPIRVEVGNQISNDYVLEVIFAPKATVSLASLAVGQNTALSVQLTQQRGELQFEEISIDPNAGNWITDGFAVDQLLGQATLVQRASLPTQDFEETQTFDLRVVSSDAQMLLINVVEPGDEDPELVVEIRQGGSLRIFPAQPPFTTGLLFNLQFDLDIDEAVFQLPTSGSTLDMDIELSSHPERLARPATRRIVSQNNQFQIS